MAKTNPQKVLRESLAPNKAVVTTARVRKAAVSPYKDGPNAIKLLSALQIFRDLSTDEIKLVNESAIATTARKGQIVYMPGKTGEALFLLMKGSVHLYRLSLEGRKLIVQTVRRLSFFGEMPIIGQYMSDVFAEAAEDCSISVMARAEVERLLLSKPEVAIRILEETGHHLLAARERLVGMAFKGIPARVASVLLGLSNDGTRTIEGMSHQDLADIVGVYRETVSAALGELRMEGIIDVRRERISILNVGRLRNKAEEEILRKRYTHSVRSKAGGRKDQEAIAMVS